MVHFVQHGLRSRFAWWWQSSPTKHLLNVNFTLFVCTQFIFITAQAIDNSSFAGRKLLRVTYDFTVVSTSRLSDHLCFDCLLLINILVKLQIKITRYWAGERKKSLSLSITDWMNLNSTMESVIDQCYLVIHFNSITWIHKVQVGVEASEWNNKQRSECQWCVSLKSWKR